MDFRTTADHNIESGLREVRSEIIELEDLIATKSYGKNELAVFVVFMCRDSKLNFKQRIRHSKKDNVLYMDIMLHLPEMQSATHEGRKRIIGEKMIKEIPKIIARYKFKDFDLDQFTEDLRDWLMKKNWIDF